MTQIEHWPNLLWKRPDLITQLLPNVDFDKVQKLRIERQKKFERPHYQNQADGIQLLPMADDLPSPPKVDLDGDYVSVGQRDDLSNEQFRQLEDAIYRLLPWRKGPFRLFDFEIDAEWRSNLKWDRILSALGPLAGKRILDIGCGNGYYMFRAAKQNPELVLGIDPSIPFFLSFELMQRFMQLPNLQYDLLGVDDLPVFDKCFDMVWCMGILYHHRNPIAILRQMFDTLKVGGVAIIESQTIPGPGTTALFPEDRYAKARNVYFVPTADCLVNWVRRSGFKNVELVSHEKVTTLEQRTTELAPYESLNDFLDPHDENLTIEGYPAPWRTVVRAERMYL